MIDENIIVEFVPAQVLEHPKNTHPGGKTEEKIRRAIRRFIQNNSFTEGEITENAPRLIIINHKFIPQRMGYDVIARIL
jgi:hypothetical protein